MARDVLNKSPLSEEHEAVYQRVLTGKVEVSNKRFIHRIIDEHGFDDDMATVVLTVGTVSWIGAIVAAMFQFNQFALDQDMILVLIITYLQGLIATYLMTRIFCDKAKVKRIADMFRRFW